MPEGYYVDLTQLIESSQKFERIPAQNGWQGVYNKTEWWHFQYKLEKQPTFLDEMELVGYSEAKLKAAGWASTEMLDHAPG
ncbi:MAG: peptidoglycan-binding protein [Myxococcaceae bacterium]|nr:peptidoglycan-binding protein [Myxococcaceae bacterium]